MTEIQNVYVFNLYENFTKLVLMPRCEMIILSVATATTYTKVVIEEQPKGMPYTRLKDWSSSQNHRNFGISCHTSTIIDRTKPKAYVQLTNGVNEVKGNIVTSCVRLTRVKTCHNMLDISHNTLDVDYVSTDISAFSAKEAIQMDKVFGEVICVQFRGGREFVTTKISENTVKVVNDKEKLKKIQKKYIQWCPIQSAN